MLRLSRGWVGALGTAIRVSHGEEIPTGRHGSFTDRGEASAAQFHSGMEDYRQRDQDGESAWQAGFEPKRAAIPPTGSVSHVRHEQAVCGLSADAESEQGALGEIQC